MVNVDAASKSTQKTTEAQGREEPWSSRKKRTMELKEEKNHGAQERQEPKICGAQCR
jgi:hypothetical protein